MPCRTNFNATGTDNWKAIALQEGRRLVSLAGHFAQRRSIRRSASGASVPSGGKPLIARGSVEGRDGALSFIIFFLCLHSKSILQSAGPQRAALSRFNSLSRPHYGFIELTPVRGRDEIKMLINITMTACRCYMRQHKHAGIPLGARSPLKRDGDSSFRVEFRSR